MITNDYSTVILPDLEATKRFAARLAKSLPQQLVIYLHGNLGVGKTTLVRALLLSLGHTGAVKSPTYTLVETYQFDALKIQHFDLYRLSDPAELEYIGIRDYITSDTICIFEWPQKGAGYIPNADLEITLEFATIGRRALLQANTAIGAKIIENIKIDDFD